MHHIACTQSPNDFIAFGNGGGGIILDTGNHVLRQVDQGTVTLVRNCIPHDL
jgi:hypothetical protein